MSQTAGDAVIDIRDLHKHFGNTRALDGLTMTVRRGQVHGFLGPNGAGKSTTIRVLLGLMRKTSGDVRLLGRDPWTDTAALHPRIAYVPGEVNLWPHLTGGEIIDLLCRMRGVAATRKAELIERFALDPTKKGRSYSKGNRQKVAIVAAFAAPVDLVILDEPTAGLDPLMEKVFQDVLHQAHDEGATVLLSSHILSEVEKVCDQISIIREGRIVESGTIGELRHLTRTSIHAELDGDPRVLDGTAGVHDLQLDGHRVAFDVDAAAMPEVMSALAAAGVRSLTSQPPSLEEIFLRHYGVSTAADPR